MEKKQEKNSDSDISTDSNSWKKHLKSPHTVLKNAADKFSESSISSQSNDQINRYKLLLQEAEQTLTGRDVLISMLQDQLKKIENQYKQSLDDTQDFRLKYCIATKELSNLRIICEQYKSEIEALNKSKKNNLLRESNTWKYEFEELTKLIKTTEANVINKITILSKATQVETLQDQNVKKDLDVLKICCSNMKQALDIQNNKLEILIEKLQVDIKKLENERNELQKQITSTEELKSIIELPPEINVIEKEVYNNELKLSKISFPISILEISSNKSETEITQSNSTSNHDCNCNNYFQTKNDKVCIESSSTSIKKIIVQLETNTKNTCVTENVVVDMKNVNKSDLETLSLSSKQLAPNLDEYSDDTEDLKHQFRILNTNYSKVVVAKDIIERELKILTQELNEKKSEVDNLKQKLNEQETFSSKLTSKNHDSISECECYLSNSSSELRDSIMLENNNLKKQITEMTNNLQQYKEEAKFKKLENEKLRRKEEELESTLSKYIQQNKETKDYKTKLEKKKLEKDEIKKEYERYKISSQTQDVLLQNEKTLLSALVEKQENEIKLLKQEIENTKIELILAQKIYQKEISQNEKSLSEISLLFKNKENDVTELLTKLRNEQKDLKHYQEENNRLRELVNKNETDTKTVELLKEVNEEVTINKVPENLLVSNNNQITKSINDTKENDDYNNILELKLQIQYLLQNLESKLLKIKCDVKNNRYDNIKLLERLNDTLSIISKFNNAVQTSESKHNCITNQENYFDECSCLVISPEKSNSFKEPTQFNWTSQELIIKKKYLSKQIESIDTKLKGIDFPLSEPNYNNLKNKKELQYKRKCYLEQIKCINKKLNENETVITEQTKMCCNLESPNKSNENVLDISNTNIGYSIFQTIKQMENDIKEIKVGLPISNYNIDQTKEVNFPQEHMVLKDMSLQYPENSHLTRSNEFNSRFGNKKSDTNISFSITGLTSENSTTETEKEDNLKQDKNVIKANCNKRSQKPEAENNTELNSIQQKECVELAKPSTSSGIPVPIPKYPKHCTDNTSTDIQRSCSNRIQQNNTLPKVDVACQCICCAKKYHNPKVNSLLRSNTCTCLTTHTQGCKSKFHAICKL